MADKAAEQLDVGDARRDQGAQGAQGALTAVEARQGVISGRVITVLLVSLVLVILALGAAYLYAR